MKKDFGSVLDRVSKKVHQERARHESEPVKGLARKPIQKKEDLCSKCQSPIQDSWKVCPNCEEPLRCLKCDLRLHPKWKVCPGCETPISRSKQEKVSGDTAQLREGHYYSGCHELDDLSNGGLPQQSVIGLVSELSDTLILILTQFLLVGAKNNEHCILVTSNMNKVFESVIKKYQDNLTLLLCDPSDNYFSKEKNVEKCQLGATSIGLGLAKILMNLDKEESKRLVLDVNDLNTKEIPDFIRSIENKVRRYNLSVLVALNPTRMTKDELASIVDLFDGNIKLDNDKISIQKLTGVHYRRDELSIDLEKLELFFS